MADYKWSGFLVVTSPLKLAFIDFFIVSSKVF